MGVPSCTIQPQIILSSWPGSETYAHLGITCSCQATTAVLWSPTRRSLRHSDTATPDGSGVNEVIGNKAIWVITIWSILGNMPKYYMVMLPHGESIGNIPKFRHIWSALVLRGLRMTCYDTDRKHYHMGLSENSVYRQYGTFSRGKGWLAHGFRCTLFSDKPIPVVKGDMVHLSRAIFFCGNRSIIFDG